MNEDLKISKTLVIQTTMSDELLVPVPLEIIAKHFAIPNLLTEAYKCMLRFLPPQ